MTRYRPPQPTGSKYITPEGARRLREELDLLWRDERPRVTLAVAAAAAQGDRSENAEYTYGKKRLHEIDRRVRFLRKRLDGMTVVDPALAGGQRDAEMPGGRGAHGGEPGQERDGALQGIGVGGLDAVPDPLELVLQAAGRRRWLRRRRCAAEAGRRRRGGRRRRRRRPSAS